MHVLDQDNLDTENKSQCKYIKINVLLKEIVIS